MMIVASADIAEIKLNLADKIGSGKNVCTEDVKWTHIGGEVAHHIIKHRVSVLFRVICHLICHTHSYTDTFISLIIYKTIE